MNFFYVNKMKQISIAIIIITVNIFQGTFVVMAKKKCRVAVKIELCKGCNLCINYCKNEVLQFSKNFNKQGYHYAEPVPDKECTGCMACAIVCPEVAIEVYDE